MLHITTRVAAVCLTTLAIAGCGGGEDATDQIGSTGGADGGSEGGAGTGGSAGVGGSAGSGDNEDSGIDATNDTSADAGEDTASDGVQTVCEKGDFRCEGDVLQTCAADGTQFINVATCKVGYCDAPGKQCDNCTPLGAKCLTPTRLQTCSDDGQMITESDCPSTAPICGQWGGTSKCLECLKSTDCKPSPNDCQMSACGVDGTCGLTSVAADTPCGVPGSGGKCDGAGECRYCATGDARCSGLVPETCDAAGKWVAGTPCGGTEPLCLGGQCVQCVDSTDCPVSANECAAPWCDAVHACGYSPKSGGTVCAGGVGKCDGSGQCNVCTPGTKICNGNVPLHCGSNGQYAVQPACADTTPNCDPATGICVQCSVASQCAASSNPCLDAVCNSNACAFTPKQLGTTCPGGTCSANGVCWACTPGSEVCSGNGIKTCNSSGQYDPVVNCVSPQPYCEPMGVDCVECTIAGQCAIPANPCLQATCSGFACGIGNQSDGTSCEVGSETGTCSGGNCRVCTTGAKRCKSGVMNVAQTCDSNGQWLDSQTCSGGTPTCSLGECTALCYAVSSDGLDDYVKTASGLSWGSEYTIDAWFYLDLSRRYSNKQPTLIEDTVFLHGGCCGGTPGGNFYNFIWVNWTNPTPSLVWSIDLGSYTSVATKTISDGVWYHVAVQMSPSAQTMYVDGALAATRTGVSTPGAGGAALPIQMGGNVADPSRFSLGGMLGPMRVSSVLRYSSAFVPTWGWGSDGSTDAVWNLTEGSGTVLNDGSGHGCNATISGATWTQVLCP